MKTAMVTQGMLVMMIVIGHAHGGVPPENGIKIQNHVETRRPMAMAMNVVETCHPHPLCYVAIDDVTFFGPGASCCQPKYSSDCKIESITAGTAVRYAWNRFQSWGRAAGAVDAMQMECDLGWDPRYVGPPSNRDWMRDPGGGDPCKAAEVWKEREKERKREYDEAVVEAKRTEQEYNNCVYCKGK